jgi:hypothetical protein
MYVFSWSEAVFCFIVHSTLSDLCLLLNSSFFG